LNLHNEKFSCPEDFFRKQSKLVSERNEIEKLKAAGEDYDKKRYDYLENFTYYDKQKKEARGRYDEGIRIRTTPEQDRNLIKYFRENQDTDYRLVGVNNMSWKKKIAVEWLSGGVATWPLIIGSFFDSNNCKDLLRRGLNEQTQYKTDDSIKPNTWYDAFKEQYKNKIKETYRAKDYR
jgi:hypothetical protein